LPVKDGMPMRHIVNGVMVPVSDPIGTASHINETHMNRSSFDYIRSKQLFCLEGQRAAFESAVPLAFPIGSMQVKAQWRPITETQKDRYFSESVTLADGSQRLYGLTAMHIVSKDLPDWFWATFEQADSLGVTQPAAGAAPLHDEFACQGATADCNRAPSGIGLEGTVWVNYRLRGTMVGFTDANGKPLVLANSQLESRVQPSTSSCMTCHARASVAWQDGRLTRLSVFDDQQDGGGMMGGVQEGQRKGFIGLPSPDWFYGPGDELSARQRLYEPLDFVWSLQNAHARH
jgi:hypothetical protein